MQEFDFEQLTTLLRDDEELKAALDAWDGSVGTLYRYLPHFEAFIKDLPKDLTFEGLQQAWGDIPVGVRLVFGVRLTQFVERWKAGYQPPVYSSFADLLVTELYANNPDKITWN